ncbi:hypothetical protein LZ30DRAFT_210723 [Colletotrichum cereale]|nr:hypothetical protein LZ30DRAFT_210723 [Colletotrichum cereale]
MGRLGTSPHLRSELRGRHRRRGPLASSTTKSARPSPTKSISYFVGRQALPYDIGLVHGSTQRRPIPLPLFFQTPSALETPSHGPAAVDPAVERPRFPPRPYSPPLSWPLAGKKMKTYIAIRVPEQGPGLPGEIPCPGGPIPGMSFCPSHVVNGVRRGG